MIAVRAEDTLPIQEGRDLHFQIEQLNKTPVAMRKLHMIISNRLLFV